MKSRLFGCRRFRRLSWEASDRILSERELMFLDRHRAVCLPCVSAERQGVQAFDALRSIALDAHPTPMFSERVIRKVRVSRARERVRYLSPALVGAGIACVVMFAALQTLQIASSTGIPPFRAGHAGARLIRHSELPRLDVPDTLSTFKR